MILDRFAIGILFRDKMFRLPSLHGLVIDEILTMIRKEDKFNSDFFNLIKPSISQEEKLSMVHLSGQSGDYENNLEITPGQFVFKKNIIADKDKHVEKEDAIDEFSDIWDLCDGILKFPHIRRIGIYGEFKIPEKDQDQASIELIDKLTHFTPPNDSGRFKLTFDEREYESNESNKNEETAAFWNKIYTFYISKMDETREDGTINANLDIQRHYNPTLKKLTGKELKGVFNRFVKEKGTLKKELIRLELVNDEEKK